MMIAWRYVGRPTEHYPGVPARDLTASEVAGLSEAQRAAVEHGGLYAPASAVALSFDDVLDSGMMTDATGARRKVRDGKVVS